MPRQWSLSAALIAVALHGAAAGAECGGASIEAPLASRSLLIDGTSVGERLVAVGERGHILVSDDEGGTWRQSRVPTRALLTAVHMHDSVTGWAVGHDAVILRTDDGGDSWQVLHCAPEEERPLLDVWFRDRETGFAVGAYGYFLATRDGGRSWEDRMISEDDFHHNFLVPAGTSGPDGHRLIIAGEAGSIYRSDDGGGTWDRVSSPYAGSWFGGVALDRERLFLAGLKGHLFGSDDGGLSWRQVHTGVGATLTSIARLQSGAILVTGLEGVLLSDSDGSGKFSLSRLQSRTGLSGSIELADGRLLLLGEFGARYRDDLVIE